LQELCGCDETDGTPERKWFNEEENLIANEILSDNEIMQPVINEEEVNPEMKQQPHEQDLVPTEKVSHSASLHHLQCLMDYTGQQEGQFFHRK
jgi:hypothetical protein